MIGTLRSTLRRAISFTHWCIHSVRFARTRGVLVRRKDILACFILLTRRVVARLVGLLFGYGSGGTIPNSLIREVV